MSPFVSADVTLSLDGFAAGPNQTVDNPMGDGFMHVHSWMFDAPDDSPDEIAAILGHSAYIMGRNMFGPVRGDWPDDSWRGWWGEEPPYHAPVFVLTHYPREPLEMDGTTFFFVTDGPDAALERAVDVAGEGTISIGGGAHTLRDYLRRGVVDELRLHIAPVVVGAGERLFDDLTGVGLTPVSSRSTPLVTHSTYRRA